MKTHGWNYALFVASKLWIYALVRVSQGLSLLDFWQMMWWNCVMLSKQKKNIPAVYSGLFIYLKRWVKFIFINNPVFCLIFKSVRKIINVTSTFCATFSPRPPGERSFIKFSPFFTQCVWQWMSFSSYDAPQGEFCVVIPWIIAFWIWLFSCGKEITKFPSLFSVSFVLVFFSKSLQCCEQNFLIRCNLDAS